MFYSQLASLGLNVQPEDTTNHGRIDLSLKIAHRVYLFEFKVVAQAAEGKALQQPIDKGYAKKYRSLRQVQRTGFRQTQGASPPLPEPVEVTLIGIEFSKAERNIVGWETLTL